MEGDLGNGKEAAARIFVHPFGRAGVRALAGLGVGAAATYANVRGAPTAPQLPASYKTDGQSDFFAYLVATDRVTGRIDPLNTVYGDGAHVRWSPQGNYAFGPVGLQAEYIRSTQRVHKGALEQTPRNWAWQATASAVLTGEDASFRGGVLPARALDEGGIGALELVARVARLKVDDRVFAMGLADPRTSAREARAWGAGLNWYVSRNVRVMADYARTVFTQGAGTPSGEVVNRAPESAVLTRAQTVF